MNTEDIFQAALKAAGLTESPKDSGIAVPKEGITKAAFGVDILMLLEIIRDYNLSCSRPMPQFELYKGGHHREV